MPTGDIEQVGDVLRAPLEPVGEHVREVGGDRRRTCSVAHAVASGQLGMRGAVHMLDRDVPTAGDLYAARQFENPRNVFAPSTAPDPSWCGRSACGSPASSPASEQGHVHGGGRGIAGAGYDPVVARAVPTAIDSPGDFRIGGGVPGVGKG